LNDNDKWRTSNNNFLVDISSIPINENNLQLRISNLEGNVSESIKYDFTINQLWYLSANAIRLYIVGVLVIYGIAYMAIRRKNNIDKKKFIEREKEKQREKIRQLEIGKLKVDKERLQLEQEKLQLELKNHNQEIAYSTYNNVKKNEMLRSLKEYIFKINGVDKGNGLNQKMKSIVSKIDNTFDDSNDWVKFDYHFKKANPNFFDRLSELHTNLTANDKRICAFMKMQIPTKQIASFLNINVKSLEMTRYRLRKKLKLKSRTDLYTYIQSI
jgi:DNA-binding CsgD family transcriptional regulator